MQLVGLVNTFIRVYTNKYTARNHTLPNNINMKDTFLNWNPNLEKQKTSFIIDYSSISLRKPLL